MRENKHKRTKRACMSITNLNAQESCKTRTNQKQVLEIKNEKKGKKQLSEFFNVPL